MPPSFIPHAGQVHNVWLKSATFHEGEAYDPELVLTFSLNVDHEVVVSDDDGTEAGIEVSLSLEWQDDDGQPTDLFPFEVSLVVRANFRWPEPRSSSSRREWADFNGVYLVWPYLRSYLGTLTAMSRLPSFTLPTLAVPRPEPWTETGEFDKVEGSASPESSRPT